MPGIDLAAFAERIRTLNAPEQGMNYRGAHSGERRYNEFDGKEYYTRGEPATLTVYGERAQLLYDLIRNCAEIADALSAPVAQGDEVRGFVRDFRLRANQCRTNNVAYCPEAASVWELAADALEGKS